MFGRIATLAFLGLTLLLAACGGSGSSAEKNKSTSVNGAQQVGVDVSPTSTTKSSTETAATQSTSALTAKALTARAAAAVAAGTYIAPAKQLKTSSGRSPAIVLLPDTGNITRAKAEAMKLSQLGFGALVVEGPPSAPKSTAAFETDVKAVQLAVKELKKKSGIDRNRIGMVGEGVGAHVGSVVAGRDPGLITAAALADIGGVVVPSKKYAPYKWLDRAAGTHVLFQRDLGARAMSEEELVKLIDVAPPGTLMEQYNKLGAAAEKSRDGWLLDQLGKG